MLDNFPKPKQVPEFESPGSLILHLNNLYKSRNTVMTIKSIFHNPLNLTLIYSILNSSPPNNGYITIIISVFTELIDSEPEIFTLLFPINNPNYLYEQLVKIYLKNAISSPKNESIQTLQENISNLISRMLKYFDCNKETFDLIYQKFAKFLRDDSNKPKLTKESFEEIMKLLDMFYGEGFIEKDTSFESSYLYNNYEGPRSYIVHQGEGKITRNLETINCSKGLSILMWFYIKNSHSDFGYTNKQDVQTILKIVLDDNKTTVTLTIDNAAENMILHSPYKTKIIPVKKKKWYLIHIRFVNAILFSNHFVDFYLLDTFNYTKKQFKEKIELPKEIPLEIKEMTFYENFYGLSTSIMILNKLDKWKSNFLKIKETYLRYGAHNLESLQYFLENDSKKYICANKILSIYVPFQYSIMNNQLIFDDCLNDGLIKCNNYIFIKGNKQVIELNNLRNRNIFVRNFPYTYNSKRTNIAVIGGISALLPLFQMILENEGKLLSFYSFDRIMNMITNILFTNKLNYIHAINHNFFDLLSYYLESIPDYCFTIKIYRYLEQIKNLFEFYYSYFTTVSHLFDNFANVNKYLECVYLNQKIISKFPDYVKEKFINSICQLIDKAGNKKITYKPISHMSFSTFANNTDTTANTNDPNTPVNNTQSNKTIPFHFLKAFCNIPSLLKLLYKILKNNAGKICCKDHYKHFVKNKSMINTDNPVKPNDFAEPSIKMQIEPLMKIILYEFENNSVSKTEEFIMVIKYFCLYLNPCMQFSFVETVLSFLKELKFNDEKEKNYFISKLKSNNILHCIFCLYKTGIIEIKYKIFEIIREFFAKLSGLIEKKDIILLRNIIIEEGEFVSYQNYLQYIRNDNYEKITNSKSFSNNFRKRNNSISIVKSYHKCLLNQYIIDTEFESEENIEEELKYNECCKKLNNCLTNKNYKDKYKPNFKYIGKILKIDKHLLNIYNYIFDLMFFQQTGERPYNYLFSIIIHLIKHSYSLPLLEKFLNDLTQIIDTFDEKVQSKKLIHFLLETAWHFTIIQESKYDQTVSDFILFNSKIKKTTPKIISSIINLLSSIIISNLQLNSKTLNISYILTWLTYHQTILNSVNNNKYKIKINTLYSFIEKIFHEVIHKFLSKLKNDSSLGSDNNSLYSENISLFINLVIEYIIFQKDNYLSLKDPVGYININNNNGSNLNLPSFLLSWIDLTENNSCTIKRNENGLIESTSINISKNSLIIALYCCFQNIWDIFKYCDKSFSGIQDNTQRKILQIDRLIEQYVYCNKSNYGKFFKEINFLLSPRNELNTKENEIECNIPLIQTFSNILNILIVKNEAKDQLSIWVDEYTNYLCFAIISSLNLQNYFPESDEEKEMDSLFFQVITFGTHFLLDQYKSSPSKDKEIYKTSLQIIFYLMFKISSNKRFTNNEESPLYNLLNIFLLDTHNRNIFLHYKQFNLKLNTYNDFEILLDPSYMSFWKEALFNNNKIGDKFKHYFNKEIILLKCSLRYLGIIFIIPDYEWSFWIDKKPTGLIKLFGLKLYNFYDKTTTLNFQEEAKQAIANSLLSLLHSFHSKRESNVLLNEQKIFKQYISENFKWTGMWSDRKTFYDKTEMFQQKIVNHYSLEFALPLITPIIDSDYFLFWKQKQKQPYMVKCNKKEFFKDLHDKINKKNQYKKHWEDNYRNEWIKAFDGIVFSAFKNRKHLIASKDEFIIDDTSSPIKKAKSVRRDTTQSLDLVPRKNSVIPVKEANDIRPKYDMPMKNINNNKDTSVLKFYVCLVKQTHHIRGSIFSKNNQLIFISLDKDEDTHHLSDKHYGLLSKTCHSALHKDDIYDYSITKTINFPINKIKYLFLKNYYYSACALEIFTTANKSYYFHFDNNEQRQKFVEIIKKDMKQITIERENHEIHLICYANIPEQIAFTSIITQWYQKQISTFEFLMWLNFSSNRSYNDLSQYPIFPWPVQDFTTDFIDDVCLRKFDLPIGQLIINKKSKNRCFKFAHNYLIEQIRYKENEIIKYKTNKPKAKNKSSLKKNITPFDAFDKRKNSSDIIFMNELSLTLQKKALHFKLKHLDELHKLLKTPSLYKVAYSNSQIVSNYLLRLYPFTSLLKYKSTKNTFKSISSFFEDCVTNLNNVSELIPDLFVISESLLNINKEPQLNDIELPSWCKNKTYKLSSIFRKVLEFYKNQEINAWINLIFGSNQRDDNAITSNNLFNPLSYKEFVVLQGREEILKPIYHKYYEKGMIPFNILHAPLGKLPPPKFWQIIDYTSDNDIKRLSFSSKIFNNKTSTPLYIKEVTDKVIYIITSNFFVHVLFFSDKLTPTSQNEYKLFKTNENKSIIPMKMSHLFFNSLSSYPIVIHDKSIIIGGLWDGNILRCVDFQSNNEPPQIISTEFDTSPITALILDKHNNILISGNKNGCIITYEYNSETNQYKLFKKITDHNSSIITLATHHKLQIFCSSSLDGYCNIYTLPTCKLIRSFKFKQTYIDNIYICSYPIPAVTFYCRELHNYHSYTINGTAIDVFPNILVNNNNPRQEDISQKIVNCYTMFTDIKFNEMVIEGTNDGYVIIRELPELRMKMCVMAFDQLIPIKTVATCQRGTGIVVLGKGKKEFVVLTTISGITNNFEMLIFQNGFI